MKKQKSDTMAKRIFWMSLVVLLGLTIIGTRLAFLMLIKGNEYSQKAANQQLSTTKLDAERGTIYDCNMNVLATSATVYTVYIVPNDIEDDETAHAIADGLAELLDVDSEAVYLKTQKDSTYEKIKQRVEQNVADQVRSFISNGGYGSIIGLDSANKRYYPNGVLASTVLGFVGDDNQGLAGIEYQYDSELAGVPGKLVSSKNARGSDMPFNYETMVEATPGNSLVLTIDEYIQYYAEQYLEDAIESNKAANRGCCIVMNVKNGEVLAMATKGDYDPNDPFTIYDETIREEVNALEGEEYTSAYNAAVQEQWRNKALNDTYEPGSVFKIITGSAGIEEGKVNSSSSFSCPGYINIYGTRYNCHELGGHGTETLMQIFENSCNPAFIEIGQRLGANLFYKYFKGYGFTELTGIDLPGEATGIYYTEDQMGPVELASESFGQTFKITPIQMITAVCAACNGGYLVQPHVVKQIIDQSGNVVKNIDTSSKRQVISETTSEQICTMLESVISNGTGKSAYVAGYRMAGKTGTSQKIDKATDSGIMRYVASFCGFAPADDPEVAIIVMIDEPTAGSYYGSQVAAPVASAIMSEILPYLGVDPIYSEEEYSRLNVKIPSVVGSNATTAKTTLEASGYTAKVVGKGTNVVRQVPLASQTAPSGSTIVLYTEEDAKPSTTKMPDLTNMTTKQVAYYAKLSGINVMLSGATSDSTGATSYKQSVAAGEEIETGSIVTVYFQYGDNVE